MDDPFEITWKQPEANKDMSLRTVLHFATKGTSQTMVKHVAAEGKFILTRAMVQHMMPEFGSIDITAYNEDARCGQKSDKTTLFYMCDLSRAYAPDITTSPNVPAGSKLMFNWTPIPAVQEGDRFKINWYTSEKDKVTYASDSFMHRGTITR